MGDTNKLLRKFYVDLRKSINALEISRAVFGLTTIDLEQIESREKNEGNSLAVDKLLDIVGRKSARTFVSFVQALRNYEFDDWADKITEEAKRNFPNIHKDLLPTATIKPVQTKSDVHRNAPDSSVSHGHLHLGSSNTVVRTQALIAEKISLYLTKSIFSLLKMSL